MTALAGDLAGAFLPGIQGLPPCGPYLKMIKYKDRGKFFATFPVNP
jgi:hypothetical protein